MTIDQGFDDGDDVDKQEIDPEEDPRQGLPPSVVLEENANGPVHLDQIPNINEKGPWIHYIGIGTLRIMDEAAWKNSGVNSTKYVQWNYLNRMCVPRSEFDDDELRYLLRVDGRFEIIDTLPEKKNK